MVNSKTQEGDRRKQRTEARYRLTKHMENGRKASSLRWRILRRALIPSNSSTGLDEQSEKGIRSISRKANRVDKPKLEHKEVISTSSPKSTEACVCYTLPNHSATELLLQRVDNSANLDDFKIYNTYDIDNTGLVLGHQKKSLLIITYSGYGLAGLLIASVTDALEVVISDGNPQLRNINANLRHFKNTEVKPMMLHWNHERALRHFQQL
ncbi:hypothetical protein LXL04_007323 [Taraxacum kok-saghyz]